MKAQNWGIGLRPQHLSELVERTTLPPLEVMVEHFAFQDGGPHGAALHRLKNRTQLLLHGLHLNIGGYDPLDRAYLQEIKRLAAILKPAIYSDHLAFSQWQGRPSFDLLPIPRTSTQRNHVIQRIQHVQDRLGFAIALENISTYQGYPADHIPELEFLQGIADAAGCGILLDLNNLYVNAHNFQFDPHEALLSLEADSIVQYHISGHRRNGNLLHDTHDQATCPEVWTLLHEAIARFGTKPVILERDDDDISLDAIFADLDAGRSYDV